MKVIAKILKAAVRQQIWSRFSMKIRLHTTHILDSQDALDMQPFLCNSKTSMHQLYQIFPVFRHSLVYISIAEWMFENLKTHFRFAVHELSML